MLRVHPCLLLLSLCALTACQPRAQAIETEAVTVDAGIQRFACEGGHLISIAGDTAQVRLGDGRQVALPSAGTGAWRSEALDFIVTADRGSLSQDEGGTFLCSRTG